MSHAVHMEDLVRPFEDRNILPGPTVLAPEDNPTVVLFSLGGMGGTSVSISVEGTGFDTKPDTKFKESSRESSKVRVENPDDPSQFVEFCRADRITLSSEKRPDKPHTSSYDTSGQGYHDFDGNQNPGSRSNSQTYSFKYPDDEETCQSPQPDRGGNC